MGIIAVWHSIQVVPLNAFLQSHKLENVTAANLEKKVAVIESPDVKYLVDSDFELMKLWKLLDLCHFITYILNLNGSFLNQPHKRCGEIEILINHNESLSLIYS